MYNITKFEYEDFTLYSISRKDEEVMQFCEIWNVKLELTDDWCCLYLPPKKDYVDNANEYHLFSCKEPSIHLALGFEDSKPKKITKYFMDDIERYDFFEEIQEEKPIETIEEDEILHTEN